MVLLFDMDEVGVMWIVEVICVEVEGICVGIGNIGLVFFMVSIGCVMVWCVSFVLLDVLIKVVDDVFYEVKCKGCNCVDCVMVV